MPSGSARLVGEGAESVTVEIGLLRGEGSDDLRRSLLAFTSACIEWLENVFYEIENAYIKRFFELGNVMVCRS